MFLVRSGTFLLSLLSYTVIVRWFVWIEGSLNVKKKTTQKSERSNGNFGFENGNNKNREIRKSRYSISDKSVFVASLVRVRVCPTTRKHVIGVKHQNFKCDRRFRRVQYRRTAEKFPRGLTRFKHTSVSIIIITVRRETVWKRKTFKPYRTV